MSSSYTEFRDLSPNEVSKRKNDLWDSLVVDYPTNFPLDERYLDLSKLESGIDLSNEDGIAEGCPIIAKFICHLSSADFGGDPALYYICYMNLVSACSEWLEDTIADKYISQNLDPMKYKLEIMVISSYYWEVWGYHKLEDERPLPYSNSNDEGEY